MGNGPDKPVQIPDNSQPSFSFFRFDNDFNTEDDDLQMYDDNLETFSLFWLDQNVNTTEENLSAQLELGQTINHLKTFDDYQQCHQHILSLSPQDRLVLIIADQYARQLTSQIHQLRQVSSIYVYRVDRKANDKWVKDFSKIKRVVVQLDVLINAIKLDQKSRSKIVGPLSMNLSLSNDNTYESINGFDRVITHSLLLINALVLMKCIDNDKQQLMTLCRKEYKNNKAQLALIDEFEREYTSDKCLWWYTRDSFLFKMLDKALRVQNIDLLLLFRFVITDIYQALKQNQCLSSVYVYHGQVMSNDELNKVEQSVGRFVSVNSFFSTSTNHPAVLGSLRDFNVSDGLHRVLFEINADPVVVTLRPFANISAFTHFENGGEVLFMAGSVFRLVNIRQDEDEQLWIIRMKLCGDAEYALKELINDLKKEYGGEVDDEVNLRFLGDVLHQMGKFDLAAKMYQRSLDELPENDPSRPYLYKSLGILTRSKGDYDASLQWFRKALTIQRQRFSFHQADIGHLHKWIGLVYSDKGKHDKALEYYSKAIEFFHQASDDHQLDIAHLYHDIGAVYKRQKQLQKALEYYQNSLTMKTKYLPTSHPSIAMSYNSIGNIYLTLGQYDLAMEYYEISLIMGLESFPSEHPYIAISHRNIGLVYESMHEWEQALIYYEKSAAIARHSFSAQHAQIVRIESDIQRVLSKSK